MPKLVWTDEDVAVIREMAGKYTASEIARHLGKEDGTLRSLCKRRKISLAPQIPCPHCGREFGNRTMAHIVYCLFAPEVWQPVVDLLLSLSDGVTLCTRAQYDAARSPDMRDAETIQRYISWSELARRLGLAEPRARVHRHTLSSPEEKQRRKQAHAEWDKPYDWAQVKDGCPLQGMNVLRGAPAVREVRKWDWRRKTYVPVGTVQTMVLR